MKYGRTKNGTRWHMLTKIAVPLCQIRQTIAIVREGWEVPREQACENCDNHLRDKGKEVRRLREKTCRPAKDVYEPRHKFEDM